LEDCRVLLGGVALTDHVSCICIGTQVQQALQDCSWPSELKRLLRSKEDASPAQNDDSSQGHGTQMRPSSNSAKSRPLSSAHATSVPAAKSSNAQLVAARYCCCGKRRWCSSTWGQPHVQTLRAMEPPVTSGSGIQQRLASALSGVWLVAVTLRRLLHHLLVLASLSKGSGVRMGVASGGLLPHTAITSCATSELAKGELLLANSFAHLLKLAHQ